MKEKSPAVREVAVAKVKCIVSAASIIIVTDWVPLPVTVKSLKLAATELENTNESWPCVKSVI